MCMYMYTKYEAFLWHGEVCTDTNDDDANANDDE